MANNLPQFRRTSTSGLGPNTTNSANNAYIPAGSFAINLTDKKVFSSDGASSFEVGSNVINKYVSGNLTMGTNNTRVNFTANSLASGNQTYFILQNDNNFVLYNTATDGSARAVFSSFTNSNTSSFDVSVPLKIASALKDSTGSNGSSGFVLQSNGTAVNWVSPSAASVNTAAPFNWSNTHSFTSNVTLANAYSNNINVTTKLQVGTPTAFDFGSLALIEMDANQNTYSQITITNGNTGTAASGDFVITADSGNDTVNFVDFGINSSTYNQAAFNLTGPLDAYLYSSNSQLVMGTASASSLIFHTGGTTTTNERMRISATGNVGIGNTAPTTALSITGSKFITGLSRHAATNTSEPTATTSEVAVHGRLWANRAMPAVREDTGPGYALSPHFAHRKIAQAQFGAGTVATSLAVTTGHMAYSAVGAATSTIVNPSNTFPFYKTGLVTAATAGSISSWRSTVAVIAGSPFFYSFRFGGPNGVAFTQAIYAYVGLTDVSTAPTAVDPTAAGSTTPGRLGVGINNSGGGALKIINNVTASAPTTTALTGAAYTNCAGYFQLDIWSDGTNYYWQIGAYTAGGFTSVVNSGTFSANRPTTGTLLYPHMWMGNQAAIAETFNVVMVTRETQA